MPWLKVSDTAVHNPRLLSVMDYPGADERLENEFLGFLLRCYASAAGFETDYIVGAGVARAAGGIRWRELTSLALAVGIFTAEQTTDGRVTYRLLEDEKDFMSMILKADREWTNARSRVNRNPKVAVPVRKRDGDQCRWCSKVVRWTDRVSGRGATYDHLNPGELDPTPETLVVACKSCNSARRNDVDSWAKTLLPAPAEPYYSAGTVEYLRRYDVLVTQSDTLPIQIPNEPEPSLDPAGTVEIPTPAVELSLGAVETPYEQSPALVGAPARVVESPEPTPAVELSLGAVETPEEQSPAPAGAPAGTGEQTPEQQPLPHSPASAQGVNGVPSSGEGEGFTLTGLAVSGQDRNKNLTIEGRGVISGTRRKRHRTRKHKRKVGHG